MNRVSRERQSATIINLTATRNRWIFLVLRRNVVPMLKIFMENQMSSLQQVIEGREIDIRCWHCGWIEARTLSWLSSMRHMSCPTCSSVIVLDTSEVRREIMRQRRQLSALHGQIVSLLDTSSKQRALRSKRQPSSRPNLDLALGHRHPDVLTSASRTTSVRRVTRG